AQIGALLAITPVLALLAPPFWGHLADRTGRADRVLSVLALGTCLSFLPLMVVRSFPAIAATCVAYSFFYSSITTVVDSLALQRVTSEGGSFSRLRLFGSVGFVVSTTLFGLAVSSVDGRVVLAA